MHSPRSIDAWPEPESAESHNVSKDNHPREVSYPILPRTTTTKAEWGTTPSKRKADPSTAPVQIQSAQLTDLLSSIQQLITIQCNLPTFTPQHAKQWFAEAEAIMNGAFIFDPAIRFFKVIRALDMDTKSNMLKLVEASPSAAALSSLKSAILRRYEIPSYWARDRMFQNLSVEGKRPTDLLRWINKTTNCPNCPMNRNWFLRSLPANLRRKFEYDDEESSLAELAEKADRILNVQERTPELQVAELCDPRYPNFQWMSPELRYSPSHSSHSWRSTSSKQNFDWKPGIRSPAGLHSPYPWPDLRARPQWGEVQICYYHKKYGQAARNCKPNCLYQQRGARVCNRITTQAAIH